MQQVSGLMPFIHRAREWDIGFAKFSDYLTHRESIIDHIDMEQLN